MASAQSIPTASDSVDPADPTPEYTIAGKLHYIQLTIPAEQYEWFKRAAKRQERSVHAHVRHLIRTVADTERGR